MGEQASDLRIESLPDGETAVVAPTPVLFESHREEELVEAVRRLTVEGGRRRLVVDLGSLRYLDSAGIGTLLSCTHIVRGAGGALGLVGIREPLRRVLSAAMILQVLPVFASVEEAAAGLGT